MPRLVAPDPAAQPSWRHVLAPVGGFLALGAGLGAASGAAWEAVVELPAYRVGSNGGASTSERGLTAIFGGDAWFCLIGAVLGLGLGWFAWWRFRQVGWPVVLVAVLTATLAGLLCWFVGTRLGPGDFTRRLAEAQPDDLVPVSLELRAKASLLVWPFLAVVPILLGSSLGADEEEAEPAIGRSVPDGP